MQKLSYRLDKADYEANEVVVCPPFTDLRTLQTLIDSDRLSIRLGAQNCHWEDSGAFTGEVSPMMLAKLNVRYVIVGHSERRQLFGETDEMVNRKLRAVMKHGMTPIVCVGETLDEREAGATAERVTSQTRAAFASVKAADAADCVLAYEPIWAIGTGRNATPDDANATIGVVRGAIRDLYGDTTAQAVRIQYGGSVKPGQHRRPDGDARDRRRARRRRVARPRRVRANRAVPALIRRLPRPRAGTLSTSRAG